MAFGIALAFGVSEKIALRNSFCPFLYTLQRKKTANLSAVLIAVSPKPMPFLHIVYPHTHPLQNVDTVVINRKYNIALVTLTGKKEGNRTPVHAPLYTNVHMQTFPSAKGWYPPISQKP